MRKSRQVSPGWAYSHPRNVIISWATTPDRTVVPDGHILQAHCFAGCDRGCRLSHIIAPAGGDIAGQALLDLGQPRNPQRQRHRRAHRLQLAAAQGVGQHSPVPGLLGDLDRLRAELG